MYNRVLLSAVALVLGLGSLADAATIIWVSDNKTPANNVPADQAWVDLLTAQGYTVNLDFRAQQARTLDATKIATLNAADLIIVSRDTDSGNYASNATEIAQWNGITAPILLQVAHIARNSRWKWLNTTSYADVQPALEAVLLTHPIFAGVPLGANNQVAILTTNCSIISSTDVGNGTLIAKRADNGGAWIVEWKQGVEFYAGSVEKAGGKRLLFSGGGTVGVSDGTYNYNDAGKQMFLNAVRYMLGIESGFPASEPNPADKAADVPRDVVLGWKPGLPDQKHDVYLGTSVADVNAASVTKPLGVLAGAGQDANTFAPAELLQYGKTYYWRIDEVNATPDATVFKGGTWSFTVEPFSYPVANVTATASSATADMGPENTVNGSGLDKSDRHSTDPKQMWLSTGSQPNWIQYEFDKAYKLDELWVWNYNQVVESIIGFGAKDVTVEYSTDGSMWTPLAGVPVFTRANGSDDYVHDTVVDFGGVLAKYVRLTINSTWGGMAQCGLSEVRFFYIPVQAREPEPAMNATGQELGVPLNWRPGREAASHKVYVSGDKDAVVNGTAPAKTVTAHSLDVPALDFGATYYWRVDEVNDAATPSVWQGDVWAFTTKEYQVIDDFESYTNDSPNRVFQTWIDGWGFSDDTFFPTGNPGNGTTATVGYDPLAGNIVEKTIIHGGKQSMPFDYNNTLEPYYAETDRTWATPQNWTISGADTLSLYFQGRAPSFVEKPSGSFLLGGGGTDIWNSADEFRFAWKRLSGNGTIVARVDSVERAVDWVKAGVMIRDTLDSGSKFAAVYITPDYGCRFQVRLMTSTAATSDSGVATPEQIAIKAPYWIKLERAGNDFKAYYSADGAAWTAMVWNPQTTAMAADVYIGLALTSHTAAAQASAEFSNVTTTGNVTGAWQVTEIGVAQPSNDPAQLYVVVQDSAGKVKVVNHPNPQATVATSWQQWSIPLQEFTSAGVNLASVKKMFIGVGDRSKPAAGGAGRLYIDDIGFGRPVPQPAGQ
jgi:regulation of enolase protein 1 (concanavalin A-like superfamily)